MAIILLDATGRKVEFNVGQSFWVHNADGTRTLITVADPTDIGIVDSVQFNPSFGGPSSHSEALVYWDVDDKTFSVMTDVSDVVLQIGQEMHIRAFNNSGGIIENGKAVYQTGATNGTPTIAKALADDLDTAVVLGVATADIANGAIGIVTSFGFVRDVDTSGFAAGDTLYLSATTAGNLENAIPDSPSFGVIVGTSIAIGGAGSVFINIVQAQALVGSVQSKIYTLPLRGVSGPNLNITGEFRTQAAGLVGDYATDFAVINNHVFLLANSLTGSGDVTFTGTSLDESTGVPSIGDTETVTVDTGAGQYYQTTKKWWEITNVDIPAGISAINYDIGVVGYSDVGNTDFKITGYRLDATSQGINSEVRFRLIKIQDDGAKKMSLVDLEDITCDSGVVGSQIIDNVRAGGDDRSFDPDVADIWPNNTVLVFKQGDFDDYFSSDENDFSSSTDDEGFILRIEQANNVDFVTIRLDYQVIA
jgi:hypothetical protein